MVDSVEQVFADVIGLTPKEHKNVLGDKWKYINAIDEKIVSVLEAEKKQKQMCIDDLSRQLREIGENFEKEFGHETGKRLMVIGEG